MDGAYAARDFAKNYSKGSSWNDQRLQLLWDSVALHSEQSIALRKEPSVQTLTNGVFMDLRGPDQGVTIDEYNKVVAEFPKTDIIPGFRASLVWLCQTKAAVTYGELSHMHETKCGANNCRYVGSAFRRQFCCQLLFSWTQNL